MKLLKPIFIALLGTSSAVQLVACGIIEGDRIHGSDLAAEEPAFADIDPSADLGPAPVAGARRTLQSFELEKLAKERGITPTSEKNRSICFERATLALTENLIEAALRDSLDAHPQTEHAILEIAEFSRNALPVGELDFPIDGLAPSGLWRGRLIYGGNRSIPIWTRVRVTDASTGKPLAYWRSSSGPDVARGDTVRVQVSSGGVLLAFETEAESSGHVGEQVTVRNPVSGQRFRGVVEARGKVIVRK
jgi:hypothetical protein